MAKIYSPAHVNNPSSMQHLVYLHPGQDLIVSVQRTDDRRANIEVAGELLKVNSSIHHADREQFRISPRENFSDWSQYSSCFLGEVWVETANSISKLVVIQNCCNQEKSRHITVVNPDCYDVRVHPHNIIEVVLYDLNFTYQDEWTWKWSPLMDLELDILGHDILSLYYLQGERQDDPSLCYSMCPRIDPGDTICRQHHMWFRFNGSVIKTNESKVQHVGNLVFQGKASKFIPDSQRMEKCLSLYVDFRKLKIGRVLDTLNQKKKEEYNPLNRSTKTYKPAQPLKPQKTIVYVPKKSVLPTIKEVDIKKVDSNDLHEGCKVLSSKPTKQTQLMTYDEYNLSLIDNHKHYGKPYWKKRWD